MDAFLQKCLAAIPVAKRSEIVGESELYKPEDDPDSATIANVRRKVGDYDRLIGDSEKKIAVIDTQLIQAKRVAVEQQKSGNATGLKQTQAKAIQLLKQKQALESDMVSQRQRRQNLELAAENLRKQKCQEEDDKLLREVNVRLKVGQETLDISERQRTVTDARKLNRNVDTLGSFLDSPLDLNDTLQRDDLLLAEFNTLELNDYVFEEPVLQQQQQQHYQPNTTVRTNSNSATLDNEY